MLEPEIGDTVIIEGIVEFIDGTLLGVKTPGLSLPFQTTVARIKEVIRRPIQVGDIVRRNGDVLAGYDYTVLAVHGSGSPLIMPHGPIRRWVVCAHKDDIPQIFQESLVYVVKAG